MAEMVVPDKKVYLIRHGNPDSSSMKRLSESGRTQITERAQQIKKDIETVLKVNYSAVGLFSSGYPRALDSVLAIGESLKMYDPIVNVSPYFWGGSEASCKEVLDVFSKNHHKVCIAVGHLDLLEQFPRWFSNKYYPQTKNTEFSKFDAKRYAAMVFIDFKTGQLVDMSKSREEQPFVEFVAEKPKQKVEVQPRKIEPVYQPVVRVLPTASFDLPKRSEPRLPKIQDAPPELESYPDDEHLPF